MNKKQIKEFNNTHNQFCKESAYLNELYSYSAVSKILDKLRRYETALQRINENDCNGHPKPVTEYRDGKMYQYAVPDEEWTKRDAKKEIFIRKKVKEIAKLIGFEVTFNGDPRGGAIRFVLPSGASNNWDQKSWGIYW